MSSALDMSLDDIIRNNKKPAADSNARSGRRFDGGPGPTRRFSNRSAARSNPYSAPPKTAPDSTWKHDLYSDQMQAPPAPAYGGAMGGRAIETGTKLYISNLEYGVSNEDIKELFSEVGDLKRFSIHYDRSGRSKGTAEVVYARRQDAVAAVKRYNNVQLDGKPMKIEIVGTNTSAPPAPQASNGGFGSSNGAPRRFPARGEFNRSSRGGSGGGRGRGRGGRGRGGGRAEPVSASDLDADLEKYHSKAMQTN